jgi:carboxymethylenebutenolidase
MPSAEPRLTRRALLVSGVAAAGYSLAAGPLAAAPIQTEAAGLVAGMVEVPAPDRRIPAYRARPEAGGPFPVVLVVHEVFGLHEYVRDVCRRLARAGYLAIAPDLYARQGDPAARASVDAILEQIVMRVADAQVMADLDASARFAVDSDHGDPKRIFATGFCWGGRIVWLYAAHSRELVAAAAWYGRLEGASRPETPEHPIDVADRELAPVLGLYGTEDAGIPVASVFAMRKKLAQVHAPSEIVLFPGAPHGFHADYRDSYRPMAAEEGWRRMLAWFHEQEKPQEGKPPGS